MDTEAMLNSNIYSVSICYNSQGGMIFKGKKTLFVTRRMVANPQFVRIFRRMYEK